MIFTTMISSLVLGTVANTAVINPLPLQTNKRAMAVAYPWVFNKGKSGSRHQAVTSAEEIARRADYASVPNDVAQAAWKKAKLPTPSYGNLPSKASLSKFGKALNVSKVIYGQVSWHTRSIWVNAGPKTISTATVSTYVFDVASGSISYQRNNVKGRSDEKSNGYKLAAAVLFTPLVTAVSGGPATPREQRAVQIALGNAYHAWVNPVVASIGNKK